MVEKGVILMYVGKKGVIKGGEDHMIIHDGIPVITII